MRRGYTSCFWNAHLKGAECKTLHDWAGLQGLHIGNQTPFQAFPSSLSRAVDIQGSSEAPLPNPHGRTANSFTFCHSRMQHTEPTPVQRLRLVRADETLSRQKDKTSMKWTELCTCARSSAEDSLFLFSSLSFPSVQQLGKIQHVLAKSGNSFI